MSGTEICAPYARAMQCPVLRQRMMLPYAYAMWVLRYAYGATISQRDVGTEIRVWQPEGGETQIQSGAPDLQPG
eukprot:576360-Rhodomonas_salina.2